MQEKELIIMQTIIEQDGLVLYQKNYTDELMENVTKDIVWRNDSISMFGKSYSQPRLTAWYGENNVIYSYSKIKMQALPWTPILLKLKNKLEADLGAKFNSVLINYYRNGLDHMSYHSDNEKELGKNPVIASISFGATRKFSLKHRNNKMTPTISIDLESQSLLVMSGKLQNFWLHKVSKSTKIQAPRLNLTFRYIYS